MKWLGDQPSDIEAHVIVTILSDKASSSSPKVPHQVSPRIAGKGKILGDIVSPAAMNPNNPLDSKPVIPAKAGIQLIKKSPCNGSISRFCPLRGVYFLLDSRLRGNDGSNELFGMEEDWN